MILFGLYKNPDMEMQLKKSHSINFLPLYEKTERLFFPNKRVAVTAEAGFQYTGGEKKKSLPAVTE